MVLGAGLSAIAQNTYGLDDSNARATKRQKAMSAWHKDMADFKARSNNERHLNELADSLASVQARAALLNRDFVLEATSVTFKNGSTAFINSTTNLHTTPMLIFSIGKNFLSKFCNITALN